ncbi:MAG: hypothetical protein ACP5JF_03255 [Candidatus Methanodesulfokora sp.]|jgi:hypothetical protein
MVLACKLFRLDEPMRTDVLIEKLKGWKESTEKEVGDKIFTLRQEISNLERWMEGVWGSLSYDFLVPIIKKNELHYEISTRTTGFFIRRDVLIVLDKKRRANRIADLMSRILFLSPGKILKASLPDEFLRKLHEEDPEATSVVFFDQVDLPSVNKLSLYGSALSSSPAYQEGLKHGRIYYVVFRERKHGFVLGITRDCVITAFSKISDRDLVEYVLDEISPFIARS